MPSVVREMICLQVVVILIFSISFGNAFDAGSFISQYCEENRTELICRYVNLKNSEIRAIQSEDFVISTKKTITFFGGDIGIVNGNFFKKFPNATAIKFMDTSLDFTSSMNSSFHHSLESLSIDHCVISNNMNSNALHSLVKLKSLDMWGSVVQYKFLDRMFLSKNVILENLKLTRSGFNNTNRNALDSLIALKVLHLCDMEITSLPWNIFERNKHLIELNLSKNKLMKMPFKNTLPNSLRILNLSFNSIRSITKLKFTGLENLRILDLSGNLIEHLNENVFDNLQQLEVLNLENNLISDVNARHFKHMRNIKKVNLVLNRLIDTEKFEENIVRTSPQKLF